MKIPFLLLAAFLATPAVAAEPAPPARPAPAVAPAVPAVPVDIKKLKAEIAALPEKQRRELLMDIRKQLPRASAQEKDTKEEAARQRWQKMRPEDRAQYRSRYTAAWEKMPPAEKAVQREKMAERLKALPEADRSLILQSLTIKPKE